MKFLVFFAIWGLCFGIVSSGRTTPRPGISNVAKVERGRVTKNPLKCGGAKQPDKKTLSSITGQKITNDEIPNTSEKNEASLKAEFDYLKRGPSGASIISAGANIEVPGNSDIAKTLCDEAVENILRLFKAGRPHEDPSSSGTGQKITSIEISNAPEKNEASLKAEFDYLKHGPSGVSMTSAGANIPVPGNSDIAKTLCDEAVENILRLCKAGRSDKDPSSSGTGQKITNNGLPNTSEKNGASLKAELDYLKRRPSGVSITSAGANIPVTGNSDIAKTLCDEAVENILRLCKAGRSDKDPSSSGTGQKITNNGLPNTSEKNGASLKAELDYLKRRPSGVSITSAGANIPVTGNSDIAKTVCDEAVENILRLFKAGRPHKDSSSSGTGQKITSFGIPNTPEKNEASLKAELDYLKHGPSGLPINSAGANIPVLGNSEIAKTLCDEAVENILRLCKAGRPTRQRSIEFENWTENHQ